MKRTYQIAVVVLAWLAGLWLASLVSTNFASWAWLILIVGFWVAIARLRSRIGYIAFAGLALFAGLMRGQLYHIHQQQLNVSDYQGARVVATGRVAGQPHWNDAKHYEFYLDDVRIDGKRVLGLMKVKSLVGSPREGQIVQAEGKVGRSLGRADAQIWYAQVNVLRSVQPYPVRVKALIARGIATALPANQAAFAQGVLFGERSELPADIQTATQDTGLTHILAVSGYNLTIVVALVLVFWKKRTWPGIVAALAAIGFFVVMTGASASVVRAAVMSAFILLIGRTRRELDARVALAATIFVMTAWDPRYLYVDIGWQLSVMALVGVLFLAPALMPKRDFRWRWLVELFVVSLAAHLATAPIIMRVFGSFSVIAPVANLLILPLIPIVMLGGFIAATLGVFWPAAALGLARPIASGINAVLELILWLAQLPTAHLPLKIDAAGLLVAYMAIGFIILLGLRKHSHPQVKKV